MRCKCCDRVLSQTELMFVDKHTGLPDELCYLCQTIARDPDNADKYPQGLDTDLFENVSDLPEISDEDSLLDQLIWVSTQQQDSLALGVTAVTAWPCIKTTEATVSVTADTFSSQKQKATAEKFNAQTEIEK